VEYFVLGFFVVLIGGAIKLRRRINDPAHPFGRWWARTIQSWYDRHAESPLKLGFQIIILLTVLLWLAIFLGSSGKDRTGVRDLFDGIYPSGSGNEKK